MTIHLLLKSVKQKVYSMRTIRIFQDSPIEVNQELKLDEFGANHVSRVLRMKPGEEIVVFNGLGSEYPSKIKEISKKEVIILPFDKKTPLNESPIKIHLVQALSKGDRMDFTIQKAVELGVTQITPIITSRCAVRLKDDRLEKKIESFKKIVISACEQCGRVFIPKVNPILELNEFFKVPDDNLKLILNPYTQTKIKELPRSQGYTLLIGPEGGLSDEEVKLAQDNNFKSVLLGPRILRTETAPLVAISILQASFGDI